MKSTQAYHDPQYFGEVWGLYAVGIIVLLARICVRLRTVGVRKFQGDDYLILFVIFCYTADAVLCTLTYQYGTNVDYTAAQLAQFNDAEIQNIIFGSKMELLAWYSYTALVWTLKACMICFYNRLTFGLDVNFYIKSLSLACAVTYVATFLTVTLACLPYSRNWQISPYPPVRCTIRAQNLYVTTCLNVVTDAAMLAIPLPILWHLRVPLTRKLALAAMLCSGVFVITAAIVRLVESLNAHPSALNENRWGLRETLAGVIAINIPILRPLFSKAFWAGNIPSTDGSPAGHHNARPSGKAGLGNKLASSTQSGHDSFQLAEVAHSTSHVNSAKLGPSTTARPADDHSDDMDDDDTASDDFIIQKHGRRSHAAYAEHAAADADVEKGRRKAGVLIETTYDVRPASRGIGVDVPAEPPSSSSYASDRDIMHGARFWDRGWQDRRLGNNVTVGSDRGAGHR
ncbi:hypothetical protein LTR36_005057 [Oleoguttula mirabilis]|uniref:Rhodopsin domain-containing protein n=1 Tax=Oleoguttula mirabilis TaxID=1507867 RepID=A0AAV9JVW7_9PEZI|nr:hypothetical protein LTR36_005057 [Oleoguttula mirabilis]